MQTDSSTRVPAPDDHSWESEKAPRISTGRMLLTFAVFGLWLAAMSWMATRRWFGSLL